MGRTGTVGDCVGHTVRNSDSAGHVDKPQQGTNSWANH